MLYAVSEDIRRWAGLSGSCIRAFAAFQPPGPVADALSAWGALARRNAGLIVSRPAWDIPGSTVSLVVPGAFGDLIRISGPESDVPKLRVLLAAPMSGHYATLLRPTVAALLGRCDVYVTEWKNARDVPASEGGFGLDRYIVTLCDYMRVLGPDTHVLAVCQPAPLVLAAVARLSRFSPGATPLSMTLMGGPVDPGVAPTAVSGFGRGVSMRAIEAMLIRTIPAGYVGRGRRVYPGSTQLAAFVSMNAGKHASAMIARVLAEVRGDAESAAKHDRFYDEYLAVTDMPAEFYLDTVRRVFREREVGLNLLTVDGERVDAGDVSSTALMVVEGENDDISAPGQCLAALDLCRNIPSGMKRYHLEPGVGHYGIFAGKSWRESIAPKVMSFMSETQGAG